MRPLVFCVGLNGYSLRYRQCVRSQRAYAKRMGFDHRLFAWRPGLIRDPSVTSWLTLPLIREALTQGRPWVLALDVDAEVMPTAPDFREVAEEGRSLYAAPGHSGRLNAGVLIARNDPSVLGFIDQAIKTCRETLPNLDRRLWENAPLIHYATDQPYLGELDPRWNRTTDPTSEDYVRHYTGPMKHHRRPTPLERGSTAILRRTVGRLMGPHAEDAGQRASDLARALY